MNFNSTSMFQSCNSPTESWQPHCIHLEFEKHGYLNDFICPTFTSSRLVPVKGFDVAEELGNISSLLSTSLLEDKTILDVMVRVEDEQYYFQSQLVIKKLRNDTVSNPFATEQKMTSQIRTERRVTVDTPLKSCDAFRCIRKCRIRECCITWASWKIWVANIVILQICTYLQASMSSQKISVLSLIIRTTTESICQPCYSKWNWASMRFWKDQETFWLLQRCIKWWRRWEQSKSQLPSTTFQWQHSKFYAPTKFYRQTKLFEIVDGIFCWKKALQNVLSNLCKESFIVPASRIWVPIHWQRMQQPNSELKWV